MLPSCFQKLESMSAHRSQRRRLWLSIRQQRNQIVTGGPHSRVLMIDYANAVLVVNQEIRTMIVAMTKHARARRQLSRDIVELDFQLSSLAVPQCLATETAKVMFEKEIQL